MLYKTATMLHETATMLHKTVFLILLAATASSAFATDTSPDEAASGARPVAVTPPYRLTGTIALGAPDRWDYLAWDAASHRIFAAHHSTVAVVDADRLSIVGRIPVAGANGIAIAASLHKGYAGSSETHAIVVFDLASLKVLGSIPSDPDTDAVAYDPATQRVFVMHGDPMIATAVDARTDRIVRRIELGGKPEFAAADGAGNLYVNMVDQGAVKRIDTHSLRITATWPLPECERPHGMALDPVAGRLFSGCVNQRLVVLDLHDGHKVAELPIGSGSDAVAFDPRRHRVLSSNGSGTLSVIDEVTPDRYVALPDVTTQPSARTMTVDPETGRVFLLAADRVERDPAAVDPRKRYGIRPGSLGILVEEPSEAKGPAADR